jgi:hypothetical protein
MPRYCDRSACTPCTAPAGEPCDVYPEIIIERAEVDEDGYLDLLLERKNKDGSYTHWEGSLSGSLLHFRLETELEEFTTNADRGYHNAS